MINCLETTSVLLQYGILIKITGSLNWKKSGYTIKSMFSGLFSLFRKSLHTLSIKPDGKLPAKTLLLSWSYFYS